MLIDDNDRRKVLRVQYRDESDRPFLKMISGEFNIVDISRTGLKFAVHNPADYAIGQRIKASLQFPKGSAYQFVGTIVRFDLDGIALQLDDVVPLDIYEKARHDRRAFFRLKYPCSERPRIQVFGARYFITEISEGGLRLRPHQLADFPVGLSVSAILTFHDGVTMDVKGTVYRIDEDEVVVRLTEGVPGNRIFAEQRYLIQKYRAVWGAV